MSEMVKLIVGVVVLILGIPIGNFLAKSTKEELKSGQRWFRIIISLSLILGFTGLIIRSDVLMFSFFFIAIVTSRSMIRNGKNKKIRRRVEKEIKS